MLDALYGPFYDRLLVPDESAPISDAYVEALVETVFCGLERNRESQNLTGTSHDSIVDRRPSRSRPVRTLRRCGRSAAMCGAVFCRDVGISCRKNVPRLCRSSSFRSCAASARRGCLTKGESRRR